MCGFDPYVFPVFFDPYLFFRMRLISIVLRLGDGMAPIVMSYQSKMKKEEL